MLQRLCTTKRKGCASLPLVLLCDVVLYILALAIDMSHVSQSTASSAGPQDPKGPKDGGSWEFEGELIDVDATNVDLPKPKDV